MTAAPLLAAALSVFAPPAVVLEVPDPPALAARPLLAGPWADLRGAPLIRAGLGRPEFDAVLDPLNFVADRLGRTPGELLAAATAGGVRAELPATGGGPAAASVAADSPETLRATLDAVRVWVARVADPLTAAAVLPPELPEGTPWELGDLRYQIDGPTLAVATGGADWPAPIDADSATLLRLAVNLDAVREAGTFPPGLAPPWDDANLGAFLGGYAATLAASSQAELTLSDSRRETGDSRGLRLRLSMDAANRPPGFFAPPDGAVPAPLDVPGAIYSAAWFRDYGALWEARRELLTASRAEFLEAKDDEVRQGVKVLGADVLPSELAGTLGASWRVVIAGGLGTDYAIAPDAALPAAGLAVSLRDPEAFERLADPLLRGIGIVAAFGGAKMQPFRLRERVASADGNDRRVRISGLRFADGPGAALAGDQARFNAAPCWLVHRGHFVLASSRPLLRAMLAALEEEAANPRFLPPGVTERQRLDPAALAAAVRGAAPAVRRALAFDAGLTPTEADDLLAAVDAALARFGPVTAETRLGDGLTLTVNFEPLR